MDLLAEVKTRKPIETEDLSPTLKRNTNIDVPARYNTIQIKSAKAEEPKKHQFAKFVKKQAFEVRP